MDVCPTDAIEKEDNGIVHIAKEKCIGCGYCTWACPYEALEMGKDSMTKCDLCMSRLGNGMPYCVEACPTGALAFGWIEGGNQVDYLPPFEITKPNFKIITPKEGKIEGEYVKEKEEKNYLGLLSFTIGSEVALFYSLLRLPYYAPISIVLLLVTLLLSINHSKFFSRSLKMIYGLKNSWLSREVIFSLLSIPFFALDLVYSPAYYVAEVLLALGVASSIMIYMLKSRPSWYNADTPISFIGSGLTVVLPLAYFFTHDVVFIAVGVLVGALEIITAHEKAKKFNTHERTLFNIPYIVLIVLSFVFAPLSIIAFVLAIYSEVNHRVEFFKKVIYYGIPNY
ncbi:4Fe-4S ferredoxin [Acidianus sp. HS-5]|nr:4Fe-4S ferredoxin [Acidianus sp. HS-5]